MSVGLGRSEFPGRSVGLGRSEGPGQPKDPGLSGVLDGQRVLVGQFRASSAKNRRTDATKTVQKMKQAVQYGCDETTDTEESEPRPAAVAFSSEEVAVLEEQVRKMISDGTFVSSRLALTMSRNSPLFDSRSPKCVENKLRAMLQSAREKGRWDRYADERGGRSRRR